MNEPSARRAPTAIDALAERYYRGALELSPIDATYLGAGGRDDLDDFSPRGWAARSDLRRGTLSELAGLDPADDVDGVTAAALTERLCLEEEVYQAGLSEMSLNNVASPFQTVRDVLDVMPTQSEADWATLAARLRAIPTALEQWQVSLDTAAARGQVAARRQVNACLAQGERMLADDGYFTRLVAPATGRSDLPASLTDDLRAAVTTAKAGYADSMARLRSRILPLAPERDAVGRDVYQLCSRGFLGTRVDLEDTYAWGKEELARIGAEALDVAGHIAPEGGIRVAIATLDATPWYRLEGTEALRAWMQDRADAAIAALTDVHFDIPEPVRRIECRIAPSQTGGIYYTGPSDDFSRPGMMWWSVPQGVTEFTTWRELTIVHHEGVPGHHLQVGQTAYRCELLNSWRRMMCWTSGHGEGWALYAERLMQELGFMDDPGNLLGLLDSQALRAARVVVDIGVHCDFPAPDEVGGGTWSYGKAWEYLTRHTTTEEGTLRFELDRYLGWPGQAPAYKIGERFWFDLREEVRRREGEAFTLKGFHRRALDLGGLGLDTLRTALLRPADA